jgi:hypothetical protein
MTQVMPIISTPLSSDIKVVNHQTAVGSLIERIFRRSPRWNSPVQSTSRATCATSGE